MNNEPLQPLPTIFTILLYREMLTHPRCTQLDQVNLSRLAPTRSRQSSPSSITSVQREQTQRIMERAGAIIMRPGSVRETTGFLQICGCRDCTGSLTTKLQHSNLLAWC